MSFGSNNNNNYLYTFTMQVLYKLLDLLEDLSFHCNNQDVVQIWIFKLRQKLILLGNGNSFIAIENFVATDQLK